MPLNNVRAVRKPGPGASEAVGLGAMVSVENAGELAADERKRGVDVLRFGGAPMHSKGDEIWIAVRDFLQRLFDRKIVRRVVG